MYFVIYLDEEFIGYSNNLEDAIIQGQISQRLRQNFDSKINIFTKKDGKEDFYISY